VRGTQPGLFSRLTFLKSRDSSLSESPSTRSVEPSVYRRAQQIVRESTQQMDIINEEVEPLPAYESNTTSMGALEKREIRQQKREMAGMKVEKRISEYQEVVENSPSKFAAQIAPRLKTPREGRKKFAVT